MRNMDSVPKPTAMLKRFVILSFIIILIIVSYQKHNTCECLRRISYKDVYSNSNLDMDALFSTPEEKELESILKDWQYRPSKASDQELIKEFDYSSNRPIQIWQHGPDTARHYGAVLLPTNYQPTEKYPLLLLAAGLDQKNPSVNLDKNNYWKKLIYHLDDHFILIPSYRGQALVVAGRRYCSDGFFGDAFDGATDDALALIDLAQSHYKNIDTSRLVAYGISRGATVVLLAGIRNPDLDLIIAQSGPTDFFNRETRVRYGFQYRYQFLSQQKPLADIRAKILKSSPLLFIHELQGNVKLIHGVDDSVVPLWHAEHLHKRFPDSSRIDFYKRQGGHRLYELEPTLKWIKG